MHTHASLLTSTNSIKCTLAQLLDFVAPFIKDPGLVWEKASLKLKLNLQWFYFPRGVYFDGTRCRTVELCSIFKAKEIFLDGVSPRVDQRILKSNTPEVGNPFPLEIEENKYDTDPYLNRVMHELFHLQDLKNGKYSEEKKPFITYKRSELWERLFKSA